MDQFCSLFSWIGVIVVSYVGIRALRYVITGLFELVRPVPKVTVGATATDDQTPSNASSSEISCQNPWSLQQLATQPVQTPAEVRAAIDRARKAHETWKNSTFSQRKQVLRIMQRFIVENQEEIVRVAVKETGKTQVDALLGEVLVTCEKIRWTIAAGEPFLQPEYRVHGNLMLANKVACVEYRPKGVIGAIVPFNYPFHNVFNPLIAALFSGNGIVIKVSENASWSINYYGKVIRACLKAGGAPVDLVQFVTGYGETGSALVSGGVDHLIFVGSPGVGKKVMETAAHTLTPVTLELGGKDAIIVCDDVNVEQMAQLVCRATYQNMGQNCIGAERILVHTNIYDKFCKTVVDIVSRMKHAPPLENHSDCGCMISQRQLEHVDALVQSSVQQGAKVLAGGKPPTAPSLAYPPTILAEVTTDMRIANEEVFGPVMAIFRIKDDAHAVQVANSCPFALGSSAFSASKARASKLSSQMHAGMTSVNDFAVHYLCQSLPFGGIGESGFGRFAGPEGLRSLCNERSVCYDRIGFLKNSIPPPLQYPTHPRAAEFCSALVMLFYGSLWLRVKAVFTLISVSMTPKGKAGSAAPKNKGE